MPNNFTRKHHNIIADMLKYRLKWQEDLTYADVCLMISKMFEEDNPNFDRNKFKKACGL